MIGRSGTGVIRLQRQPDGASRRMCSSNTSASKPVRSGFTLLEVIIALSMTAVLAAVSVRGFRSAAVNSVANATSARSFALDLTRVRRLTIQSGQPHGVRFQRTRGVITGYQVFRKESNGSTKVIETPRSFPREAEVTTRRRDLEFRIDGSAAHSSEILFQAERRRWRISVPVATGLPAVTETKS